MNETLAQKDEPAHSDLLGNGEAAIIVCSERVNKHPWYFHINTYYTPNIPTYRSRSLTKYCHN